MKRYAFGLVVLALTSGQMCGQYGTQPATEFPFDGDWMLAVYGDNHIGNCVTIEQGRVTAILIAGPEMVTCSTPGRVIASEDLVLSGNNVSFSFTVDNTGMTLPGNGTNIETFSGVRNLDGSVTGTLTITVLLDGQELATIPYACVMNRR